ncbi:hypothetical protein B0H14DRAFT_3152401 [Mycena olivaceomarginata]|nr:hypothetical protein B0H14DRAFT_3152401 [Mycena olivaceomarginata]
MDGIWDSSRPFLRKDSPGRYENELKMSTNSASRPSHTQVIWKESTSIVSISWLQGGDDAVHYPNGICKGGYGAKWRAPVLRARRTGGVGGADPHSKTESAKKAGIHSLERVHKKVEGNSPKATSSTNGTGREGATRWGASGSGGGAGPVGAARWLSRANADVVATESCAGYVQVGTRGDARPPKSAMLRDEGRSVRVRMGLGARIVVSAAGAMDEGARWMWGWREKGASPMRRVTAAARAGGTDARRIAAYSEQWVVDGVSGYAPSSAIAGDVRGRIVSQYGCIRLRAGVLRVRKVAAWVVRRRDCGHVPRRRARGRTVGDEMCVKTDGDASGQESASVMVRIQLRSAWGSARRRHVWRAGVELDGGDAEWGDDWVTSERVRCTGQNINGCDGVVADRAAIVAARERLIVGKNVWREARRRIRGNDVDGRVLGEA